MITKIFKYRLEIRSIQKVGLPVGAITLHVATIDEQPYLWAEVDPHADIEGRTIYTYGTGHEIDDQDREYIGTYMLAGGELVFHVMEDPQ